MKKLLLVLLSLLCLNGLQAQALQTVTAKGDLNHDGVADQVVFDPQNFNDDNFAIYFGDGHGDFALFRSYVVRLSSSTQISISDKGVMRIQDGTSGNCDVFLFRYEDGDFRCTGGKMDRHDRFHYDMSYNFLTGKEVRTDGEGKNKVSSTSTMPDIPTLKFGWFPLDFEVLGYLFEEKGFEDLMEYKTIMGLFLLLPENDLLSDDLSLYDMYRLSYDWRKDDDGGWTKGYEILHPAEFNIFSDLTIKRQEDGSYQIRTLYSFHDRSYEQYLDEDGENLEEAMERADQEREGPAYSSKETVWFFKEGKFTMISSETQEE